MTTENLLASVATLSAAEREALSARVEAERRKRESRRQFWSYYPDTGPLRRDLYYKHVEFFTLGKTNIERAFIAANRSGKTFCAAYEVTCHLTGLYPTWWPGFRFTTPCEWWACGTDAKAVRDTIQNKLLGKFGEWGSGMIPFECLTGKPTAGGVPESVDTIRIKHVTDGKADGVSVLGFKNYEQDRESYQGTQKDGVWFDEEPPMAIYSEGRTRTMSTTPGRPNGLTICTFTPLLGISDVVKLYMPDLGPLALIQAEGQQR